MDLLAQGLRVGVVWKLKAFLHLYIIYVGRKPSEVKVFMFWRLILLVVLRVKAIASHPRSIDRCEFKQISSDATF